MGSREVQLDEMLDKGELLFAGELKHTIGESKKERGCEQWIRSHLFTFSRLCSLDELAPPISIEKYNKMSKNKIFLSVSIYNSYKQRTELPNPNSIITTFQDPFLELLRPQTLEENSSTQKLANFEKSTLKKFNQRFTKITYLIKS
ncbi:hypothetical protein Avbf_13856 [Armadillidium vulgare]|nr:hypothetical protein Avbf_13856 [Armadillidium vulgare]